MAKTLTQKVIGRTVRERRQELKLSTTQLARKAGISQPQVSRLENGHQGFRSSVLVKLASALKVPSFRLLMTEEEWEQYSGTHA